MAEPSRNPGHRRPSRAQRRADPARLSKPLIATVIGTAVVAAIIAAYADGWRPFRPSPTGPTIVVYRDPPCLCCMRWIEYLRDRGFDVEEHVTPDLAGIRRKFGVPDTLKSCHTAVVEGYVIEGHVPAEAIERLVRERPTIRGLALPGMPGASPGMERYSTERESFDVLSFASDGRSETFSHHPAATPAP